MNGQGKARKSYTIWRRVLLGLCIFVGIGALAGGGLAVIVPDGSLMSAQELIPVVQKAPLVGPYIDSLLIPGLALLLLVCLPQAVAAILLLRRHPAQYRAGIICGVFMAAVTIGELVILGTNFLSWLYLSFAVVEIVAGMWLSKMSRVSK